MASHPFSKDDRRGWVHNREENSSFVTNVLQGLNSDDTEVFVESLLKLLKSVHATSLNINAEFDRQISNHTRGTHSPFFSSANKAYCKKRMC